MTQYRSASIIGSQRLILLFVRTEVLPLVLLKIRVFYTALPED